MKIHAIVVAIVLLLMVSLAFAEQNTVTYGEVAVVNTPAGAVVAGEEMTVPAQPVARTATAAAPHKKAAQHKVNQQQAAAKATQAANEAVLKKPEPTIKVEKTTTTTDVYDKTVKNKYGTTNYAVVEKTVTNPQGHTSTDGVIYSSYDPSKAARANAKRMEISLAGGQTMLYNKDNRGDRYGTNGLAASMSALRYLTDHLAVGLDYMMLHPREKTHGNGADQRHYHGIYAHNISVAGEFTLNPWDSLQVYLPMGAGMMNARMKTVVNGADDGDNKWGASFYAGVGAQYDITACLFAGLEYRYTYGWISDKDLTPFHKDRDLQFHTVMLRVGMRF